MALDGLFSFSSSLPNLFQNKALDCKRHPAAFRVDLHEITLTGLLDRQRVEPFVCFGFAHFLPHVDDDATKCCRALGPITSVSFPSRMPPEHPGSPTSLLLHDKISLCFGHNRPTCVSKIVGLKLCCCTTPGTVCNVVLVC